MDWIKKKFKGRARKFSEGHYHGRYAEDPQFYAPSGTRVFISVTVTVSPFLFLYCYCYVLNFFDDLITSIKGPIS